MAKPKSGKPQQLKARLPRGLADRSAGEIAATRHMVEAIRVVFERYGFEPVETPAIEYTDALGKFLPDQDRPNEGVFSFQDDDEQWLSLRYDLTAPLARYVAENYQNLALPYRSYRYGWVFRNEKPGPGRFRQFMQFDADTVGAAGMAADAEMCMLAADTMEALGIKRGDYVVKVNNRKVLDGMMDAIGLGGDDKAETRLRVLRAVDKYDRLGGLAVEQLLADGRTDESGDRTPGANLSRDQIGYVMSIFAPPGLNEKMSSNLETWEIEDSRFTHPGFEPDQNKIPITNKGTISAARNVFPHNAIYQVGLDELEQIAEFVHSAKYGSRRICVEPSVVRGLEYYTGPVYEVELTFEIDDDKGRPIRFGSVGGGGRYDGLVSRFMGQPVPATGFSIGVSRLQAALTALGKVSDKPPYGPVVVTVFDKDHIADYQRMVSRLRAAGIHAEMYLGSGKFGPQMKYADKRNSPCVIIQGSNERDRHEVQIKDLILGATLTTIKDRDEYLKRQAEAQITVHEDRLVEVVRSLLERHNLGQV